MTHRRRYVLIVAILATPGLALGQDRPIVDPAREPPPPNYETRRDRGGYYDPAPITAPETHVVRRGDTLWDLCAYYLGNPWRWPKVWSYNPKITNPHWIYPGDIVRFYPEAGVRTPVGPMPRAEELPPAPPETVRLRDRGFVTDEELRASGQIVGSKEEKLMLSTHDQAYVEFGRGTRVRPGQRFSIYRVLKPTRNPKSGDRVGQQVEIVGTGEIIGRTDQKVVKMRVVEALNPIERGHRVGPLRTLFQVIAPKRNERRVEGHIFETFLAEGKLAGSQQLVYIDRGRRDGVEIGNRFFVIRRGDGYRRLLEDEETQQDRFPPEILAEVLVVETRPRFSTGWVTRSLKEVKVGDRVEMRRGY